MNSRLKIQIFSQALKYFVKNLSILFNILSNWFSTKFLGNFFCLLLKILFGKTNLLSYPKLKRKDCKLKLLFHLVCSIIPQHHFHLFSFYFQKRLSVLNAVKSSSVVFNGSLGSIQVVLSWLYARVMFVLVNSLSLLTFLCP